MSGKRDREDKFQIDEKTLDYKKIEQKDNQMSQKGERMQQERKFLKILPSESKETGLPIRAPLLNMLDKQSVQNQTQTKKQEKTDTIQKQKDPEPNKEDQKQVKPTQSYNSIFGDYFKKGVGLFTNTNAHTPNNPPTVSNFNFGGQKNSERNLNIFKCSRQSLFYKQPQQEKINDRNQKNKDKQIQQIEKKQEKPIEKQKLKQRTIEKQKPKQKSLNEKGKDDDQDAQEDDEGEQQYQKALQKEQIINLDPTKSTGKYEYNKECDILFQSKATKMKKSNSEVIEDIQVVVQEDPQTKRRWIVIRLIQTKVRILTGLVLKEISSIKNFGGKQENVVFSVLKIAKKDLKPEKEIIKLQFENPEQSKKFIETIQNIIS